MEANLFGKGGIKRKFDQIAFLSSAEKTISIPKGEREFDSSLYGATVRKGFSKLHRDASTSDLVLIVGEEKIPVHKVVLCAWSDTFRGMLDSGFWQESTQKELPVNVEPEDYNNFKQLIEYMYTGNTDFVNDSNIVPLMTLSNYYGVDALKEVCGKLLGEQINEGNVHFLLQLIDKYDCKSLEVACGEFLAENFHTMWQDDRRAMLQLRPDTWAAMLLSDDLSVPTEQVLFESVLQYADQFSTEEERQGILNKLLPGVRYSFIAAKYLAEVIENDEYLSSLPLMQKILFENYRFKAYSKMIPTSFIARMRTGFIKFDEEHKSPAITLTNEGLTASTTSGGWVSVQTTLPFNEANIYCEFKCDTSSNMMIGAMQGNVPLSGYIGQQTNGYSLHSTDGNLFYNGGNTMAKGVTWMTGDVIGVSYDPSSGELTWYKGGKKVASHTIGLNLDNLFPAVSYAGANTVTLIPRPPLPDELSGKLSLRRGLGKKSRLG